MLKQSLGADPVDLTAKSSGLSAGLKALIAVLSSVAGIAILMVVAIYVFKRQRQKQQAIALQSGLEKADTSRSASMDGDAGWTEAQIQKAREVHRIHGVFDGDVLPENGEGALAAGATADFGANSAVSAGQYNSVDIQSGSSPYYDARRIKAAYLKRHPSFELKSREEQQQILSTMSHDDQQQYASIMEDAIEEESEADRTTTHRSNPSASSAANLLASPSQQDSQKGSNKAIYYDTPMEDLRAAGPGDRYFDARKASESQANYYEAATPNEPLQTPSEPLYTPYRDELEPQYTPQRRAPKPIPPPAPIFLNPSADVRMKPTFHDGPSPLASAQQSTDDLFEDQNASSSVPLRDLQQRFGRAR